MSRFVSTPTGTEELGAFSMTRAAVISPPDGLMRSELLGIAIFSSSKCEANEQGRMRAVNGRSAGQSDGSSDLSATRAIQSGVCDPVRAFPIADGGFAAFPLREVGR